jgi:diguanylate cyclase
VAISSSTFLAAHSMMEIFAIIVAALVFFTGHGAQETVRSIRSMVLGCAFLAVAMFDVLHFLSYMGMPDLLSPNSPHKSILFWLCGRYAAGIGLLAYVLLPETPCRALPGEPLRLGSGCCSWWARFLMGFWCRRTACRRCMSAGQGLTPLKMTLEWGVSGLYLAVAALLYLRRCADYPLRYPRA